MNRLTMEQFVKSDRYQNEWVLHKSKMGTLSIFVRKSRFIPGTYEIANMGALDGVGSMWSFYKRWNDILPMVDENCLNPKLRRYLEKIGFWFYENEWMPLAPTGISPLLRSRYPFYSECGSYTEFLSRARKSALAE